MVLMPHGFCMHSHDSYISVEIWGIKPSPHVSVNDIKCGNSVLERTCLGR